MEQFKQIIAWELLFIFIFSALIIIDSTDNIITGMAVQGVTKETILADLESTIPKLDFINDVQDGTLCLIVNVDANTKYSYEIVKVGEAIAVTASDSLYCKGQNNEDFVVSYINYDKLKQHITSPPTFEQLRQTSDGTNFYVLPSKQVLAGSTLANPQEFNDKFGTVLRNNFASEEVDALLNPTTAGTEQAVSYASYVFYLVAGLLALVVTILVLVFSHAKKPAIKENLELTAFIKSSQAQGYQQEQIYQSLIQSGWKEEEIQQAFKAVNSEVTMPQGFT